MKQPRILVVGSSNTDMIVRALRIPRPGETILGGAFSIAAGGKGANQAVAAARAGGNVTFIARVGEDDFGKRAIAGFIRDRIEVRHIQRDKHHPTGVALICVADNGENSIAVAPGANGRLSSADVKQAEHVFLRADVLLTQLESPLATVLAAIRLATKHGVPVILNPSPARQLPETLLGQISILTPNETEAEILTGVKVTTAASAAKAANQLHARSVRTVVITLGARGVFLSNDGAQRLLPAFKVKAVDTTAAGDVFNGALAGALAEKQNLVAAIRFASAAAALSVTRLERFSKIISGFEQKVLEPFGRFWQKMRVAHARGSTECGERHVGGTPRGDGCCAQQAVVHPAQCHAFPPAGVATRDALSAVLSH